MLWFHGAIATMNNQWSALRNRFRNGFPFLCALALLASCSRANQENRVVVYTSVDDVYSRDIAERFTRQTGVQVLLLTDTEETKSTGLVNRLIAEKDRPQADVFWSGDPARTEVLKRHGVTMAYRSASASPRQLAMGDAEQHFTALSSRLRVLLYNRDLVPPDRVPQSVFDLAKPEFRGRACVANPLFGTTSMHAAALFQLLGEERAREFFASLTSNHVAMLSSNGEVKRRVAAGDYAIGLTDSDDANVALQDGKPVGWVLPDQEGIGTLLIPNAVCLIAGGPHQDNGRKFIDFVLSAEAETLLAESSAVQIPLREGLPTPKFFHRPLNEIRTMKIDYSALADQLEHLSGGFLGEWVSEHTNEAAPRTP